MATKTFSYLVDDIDGTTIEDGAGGTVPFALDGVAYEIDLTAKNTKQLSEAMAMFIDHARRVSGAPTPGRRQARKRATVYQHSPREIRDWARSNNIQVPDRGRIPKETRLQFLAAQQA